MLRYKIEVTVKWKDIFSFKIKKCPIGESKRFQTLWIWAILPVTCTALGDLHIYTKHILAYN